MRFSRCVLLFGCRDGPEVRNNVGVRVPASARHSCVHCMCPRGDLLLYKVPGAEQRRSKAELLSHIAADTPAKRVAAHAAGVNVYVPGIEPPFVASTSLEGAPYDILHSLAGIYARLNTQARGCYSQPGRAAITAAVASLRPYRSANATALVPSDADVLVPKSLQSKMLSNIATLHDII